MFGGDESKSPSQIRSSVINPQPAEDENALIGKRVVICEDEGITQMQLKRVLKHAGMNVVGIAGNGQAGVELILREKPDLVLMDIKMPIMDGLEASRYILTQLSICIIILSAYATEDYQKEAEKIGVCGYILKPISGQTLLPQIQEALRRCLAR